MAISRITESIIRNEHSVMPVSSYIDGPYGLTDICLSVPTIVGQNGAEKVLETPLNESEKKQLCDSAGELKKIIENLEL